MTVGRDFSSRFIREPPAKLSVVKKKRQLPSHLRYVTSRHHEAIFTVPQIHDLRRLVAFFRHKREATMKRVDDAQANCAWKATDVGGTEQIELLDAVYRPQLIDVVTFDPV